MGALKNINAEPKLTNYLVENKLIKMNVLDIGARGGFSYYWQTYKDCLNIVGFDPDEEQERISDGQCKARILSSDGKNRVFFITRYPASSGFYQPDIEIADRLQNRYLLNVMSTVEVSTVTMDSFNLKPDFIKLDTEGAELDILKGGVETLKNALGVSAEVSFNGLFKGAPLFSEVDEFIKSQGFKLYDLDTARLSRRGENECEMCDGKVGQVMFGQTLYFRDIYKDLDNYSEEAILKLASLYELFNLTDCTYELINNPRTRGYLDKL